MTEGQEGAFPGEIGGFADAMRYRSRDLRSAEGSFATERDRLGYSIGPALRAHIPRRFARTEQRLHNTRINRIDLAVAVEVVVAQCVFVRIAEERLHDA